MSRFSPATDLALSRDASGRFMPWVIAVMVFLAMLSLAGALAMHQAVAGWQRGIEGRLTVQIAEIAGQPMAPRMAAALRELKAVPSVLKAEPLSRPAVEALLAPWIGRENLGPELPLPGLIDVEASGGIDLKALNARLAATVPGATIDDPKPWLERLVRLARIVEGLGVGIVAGIGLATVAMVIFATRAGLAAHRDAIEVLHLIGAHDSYIARQFQWQTFRLALWGAFPGGLLAALTLLVLGFLGAGLEAGILPALVFGPAIWLTLAALPATAVIVATATARLAVMGALRAML